MDSAPFLFVPIERRIALRLFDAVDRVGLVFTDR